MVVLKRTESELSSIILADILSYILSYLFVRLLELEDWWSLYLRMLGKGKVYNTTKNYSHVLVFFLWWLVESLNEKLVNNWIVDHLERNICYGLFLISNFFKWCLDLLQSIADLLTVVSDRIATNTTGRG